MKRFSIIVTGKVQGVGYRYYAKDYADRYGIFGWIRNNSDGTVAIEAQGDERVLQRFIDDLRDGPSMSNVVDINVREVPVVQEEHQFSIQSTI